MYKLHAPMWDKNNTLRKLLKEILGYSDYEIEIMESNSFGIDVAINLTIEQAQLITKIFLDNDFQIYLKDSSDKTIYWNQLGIDWIDEPPKSHYCDEPIISKEQRVDVFTPRKIDRPIQEYIFDNKPTITCPYCHSTNTKKISGTKRWLSTGLFGLASSKIGKQWHCNSCKSDF